MITGFNTDIEYQGVTYHVQTEDKGMKTPLILSLVYNRGTILASKRSPYNDLLNGEFDENLLAERLQKQHKLICAAIRAGRLEDLKQMAAKAAAEKQAGAVAQKEVKIPKPKEELLPSVEKKIEDAPFPQLLAQDSAPATVEENISGAQTAAEESVWDIPLSILEETLILDDAQIVEEEVIYTDVVEIVSTDEETDDESLKIEMLDNITFQSGERKALALIVKRNGSGVILEGAHIMVKIVGSSFRPLIFHSKTDSNGVAVVHLQLPHFRAGRAAVIVKAMHGGEEVEIRRSIQHD